MEEFVVTNITNKEDFIKVANKTGLRWRGKESVDSKFYDSIWDYPRTGMYIFVRENLTYSETIYGNLKEIPCKDYLKEYKVKANKLNWINI
jgi:hypothetical protein